jgi:hypothetical protein
MTTYYNYQLGLSGGSMINLGVEVAGATVPAPKADPVRFSQYIPLADGSTRGLGWYYVDWKFGILSAAQRTILRTYCPAGYASYPVYMVTRTQEGDAFGLFSAWMVWPQQEARDYLRRPNFTLRFNRMVAL